MDIIFDDWPSFFEMSPQQLKWILGPSLTLLTTKNDKEKAEVCIHVMQICAAANLEAYNQPARESSTSQW